MDRFGSGRNSLVPGDEPGGPVGNVPGDPEAMDGEGSETRPEGTVVAPSVPAPPRPDEHADNSTPKASIAAAGFIGPILPARLAGGSLLW
jgi:hypothetical protein